MSGRSDVQEGGSALPLEIAPDFLAKLRHDGKPHAVLDVREAWELDICRLTGCLHIPLDELTRRVDELPKDRPIVVVCHTGRRSLMATRFLRDAGVAQATNLIGGVEAWAIDVDPDMQRY
ncbi:MAG: rhodanese-like domain-containing protein [Geminicoccaceae bacterium]